MIDEPNCPRFIEIDSETRRLLWKAVQQGEQILTPEELEEWASCLINDVIDAND